MDDASVYCRKNSIVVCVSGRVRIRQCCGVCMRSFGCWAGVGTEGAGRSAVQVVGLAVVTRGSRVLVVEVRMALVVRRSAEGMLAGVVHNLVTRAESARL